MSANKWDADNYNRHADFVSNLALPVVDLLNPQENEKILDLGCGEGTLAVEIEKSGASVVAVDLSESMVEKTQEKGIEAYVTSATELPFENEFDAVFSNAVLHWVQEPETAIKKIAKALKADGRFDAMQAVFDSHEEYGAFQNPWYFPKETEYKELLEANGFRVDAIELIPRPTVIDDIANWLGCLPLALEMTIFPALCGKGSKPWSRGCWRRPTAASSTSTKSICWTTILSIFFWMRRPWASTSWNGKESP